MFSSFGRRRCIEDRLNVVTTLLLGDNMLAKRQLVALLFTWAICVARRTLPEAAARAVAACSW